MNNFTNAPAATVAPLIGGIEPVKSECPPLTYFPDWLANATGDDRRRELVSLKSRLLHHDVAKAVLEAERAPIMVRLTTIRFLINESDVPVPELEAEVKELDQAEKALRLEIDKLRNKMFRCSDKTRRILEAPAATDQTVYLPTEVVGRILMYLGPKDIFQAQPHTLSKHWHGLIEANRPTMVYMSVVPHLRYHDKRSWVNPHSMPVTCMADRYVTAATRNRIMRQWMELVNLPVKDSDHGDDRAWSQYGMWVTAERDADGEAVMFRPKRRNGYGPNVDAVGTVMAVGFDHHGCAVLTTKEIIVFSKDQQYDPAHRLPLPVVAVGKPVAVAYESGVQAEKKDTVELRNRLTRAGKSDPQTHRPYTQHTLCEMALKVAQRTDTMHTDAHAIEVAHERLIARVDELSNRFYLDQDKSVEAELKKAKADRDEVSAKLKESAGTSEHDVVKRWFEYSVVKEGVLCPVFASGRKRVHVAFVTADQQLSVYTMEQPADDPNSNGWNVTLRPTDGIAQGARKKDVKLVTDGNNKVTLTYNTGLKGKGIKSCIVRSPSPANGWVQVQSMWSRDMQQRVVHDLVFVPGVGYYALTDKGLYLQSGLKKHEWLKLTNTKAVSTRLTVLRNGRVAVTRNTRDPLYIA